MAFESKYLSVEQYLRRLSGLDKEVLLVDHNYVKAWNAHPDSHRTKPAHLLFMKGLQRYPLSDVNVIDEDVDVESVDEPITNPFDNPKSKVLPSECERNLRNTQLFRETEQEDFDLSKFSSSQRKLYQQVMNVLYDDKLAKLCHSGSLNEPLKRRTSLDKAARQMRQIFGLVFWNMDLLSWLHKTLLNNLEVSTLSIYIDVLQTLKAKVPTLVDRVLQSCAGTTVGDAVIQIFKKSWDPVSPILNQNKPKKLPGNAIILICPSRPNQGTQHSPRLRYWLHNLGCLCKVLNLASHQEEGKDFSTFEESLEHLMASIRNKVIETKNHYPNRPLILLGWTLGALLACHDLNDLSSGQQSAYPFRWWPKCIHVLHRRHRGLFGPVMRANRAGGGGWG
ncbi:hypothetical protein JTE90_027160 [Oedothorax gibbosus]|uniref:KANSL3 helical domain-containing protein n=1 Tax=Oedothorax gibbosus TaxID=931172 RepID=A0AAV6TYL3_9ARAC|nr:hypothetical protein JTE90_027160 [Oedothorax gibbosus]